MRSLRYSANLSLGPPGRAPDRLRIWKAGANPGDYGVLNFTPRAAASVMAAFRARGNAGAIDVEHGTNPMVNTSPDPAKPPPGGGYYTLELVETGVGPELWAAVSWSTYARAQIEGGERRYISPDWDMDPDTREPIRLHKFSLVQEPGTYGIAMLASRAGSERRGMDPILLAALKAALSNADAAAAVESIKALVAEVDAASGSPGDGAPVDGETAAVPEQDPACRPGVAVAASKVNAPAPRKTPGAPLTAEGVRVIMREEAQKGALIASAARRPGMTASLASLLAARPFSEVRDIVGALPEAPKDEPALPVLGAPIGATAAREEESSPDERAAIDHLGRQWPSRPDVVVRAAAAQGAVVEAKRAPGEWSVMDLERLREGCKDDAFQAGERKG